MISTDRWFWCDQCGHQAIRCPHCQNISCSGGGCDLCDSEFTEANQLIAEGKAPAKEFLPIRCRREDIDKLFRGEL